VVLAGLEALREAIASGALAPTAGLRTQLRLLAQDADDAVASAADELLERA